MRSYGLTVKAFSKFIGAVDLAFCFAIESQCRLKQVVWLLDLGENRRHNHFLV